MLSSVYLVEYTLHQNLMIEIHTQNFDLHITVPSPNLAFLCRNLDYKPYSINQSINQSINETLHNYDICNRRSLLIRRWWTMRRWLSRRWLSRRWCSRRRLWRWCSRRRLWRWCSRRRLWRRWCRRLL